MSKTALGGILVVLVVIAAVYFFGSMQRANLSQSVPTEATTTAIVPSTVTVPVKPTCTLSVSPTVVHPGQPYTFTWSSTNADFGYRGTDLKATPVSYRLPVMGTETSYADPVSSGSHPTYTIGFSGKGGQASCSATYAVVGSTETIYQIPSDILLAPGVPASTNDGVLSVLLRGVSDDSNTVTVDVTAKGKTTTGVKLPISDTKSNFRVVGDYRLEACGTMNDSVEVMVTSAFTDPGKSTCEWRGG